MHWLPMRQSPMDFCWGITVLMQSTTTCTHATTVTPYFMCLASPLHDIWDHQNHCQYVRMVAQEPQSAGVNYVCSQREHIPCRYCTHGAHQKCEEIPPWFALTDDTLSLYRRWAEASYHGMQAQVWQVNISFTRSLTTGLNGFQRNPQALDWLMLNGTMKKTRYSNSQSTIWGCSRLAHQEFLQPTNFAWGFQARKKDAGRHDCHRKRMGNFQSKVWSFQTSRAQITSRRTSEWFVVGIPGHRLHRPCEWHVWHPCVVRPTRGREMPTQSNMKLTRHGKRTR